MRNKSTVVLTVLLGIIATLEFIYFFQFHQTPFADLLMVDANIYHLKALKIIEKGWIGDGVSYQAPLYPYFLALIYNLVGVKIYWVQITQGLLALSTLLLVFGLGKTLFNEKIGLFSAVIFVFYGVFQFYTGLLSKVPLSVFFTTLLLLILLKALNGARGIFYFWGGVILAINLTLRENYYLVFPILLFWILFIVPPPPLSSHRENVKWAFFFIGGALLFLSPFILRNYYHSGELIFTSYQGGPNFYIGNNPNSQGFYTRLPFARANPEFEEKDFKAEAERRMGRPLSPREVSHFWFKQTLAHFKENPLLFPKLFFLKLYLLLNNYEIPDNYDYYFVRSLTPVLRIGFVSFGLLIPLALAGLFFSRSRSPAFLLHYFFIAGYTFSVLIFFVNSRYRMPLIPALIPFMSYTLVEGWTKISRWKKNEIVLTLLMLLLVMLVSFMPYAQTKDFSFSYFKLGVEYEKKGRLDEAGAAYRKALALHPDFSWACNALGGVLEKKGELNEAIAEYQRAIAIEPELAEAHFNLAATWQKKGELDPAIREYRIVLNLKPETPEAYNNLGTLYEQKGWPDQAENAYRQALRLQPGFIEALNNLGVLYMKTGRFSKANTTFKRALSLFPGHPLIQKNADVLKNREDLN